MESVVQSSAFKRATREKKENNTKWNGTHLETRGGENRDVEHENKNKSEAK